MRRRTTTYLAAATACVAALSACSSSGSGDGGGGGGGGGGGSQIVLGNISSKSGQYSICPPGDVGLKIAVDEINAAGGVKVGDKSYTFKIEQLDDASDPAKSATDARQLIQDGAKIIFGPCGSGAASVLQLTKASKIILVSSASSAGAAIKVGGPRQYLLTSLPSVDDRQASAVDAAKHFFPDAKKMVFIGSDDPTFDAVVASTKRQWEAAGGTDETVLYPPGTSDLSGYLAKVRAATPDVIYIGENTQSVTLALSQMDAAGIDKNIPVIGHGTEASLAKQAAGHPYIAVPFSPGPVAGEGASPASQALADKYLKATGQSALPAYTPPVRYFYDIVQIFAKALTSAGTADDPDKLLDQILGKDLGYTGALGKVTFSPDGFIKFPLASTFVDQAGKQTTITWSPTS